MRVTVKVFFALLFLYTTFLFVTYNKSRELTRHFSGILKVMCFFLTISKGSKQEQQTNQSNIPIDKTPVEKSLIKEVPLKKTVPLKTPVASKPVVEPPKAGEYHRLFFS